jgi:hypothetical protein
MPRRASLTGPLSLQTAAFYQFRIASRTSEMSFPHRADIR